MAHSDELKTTPNSGERVPGGVVAVELTFAEPLLKLGNGTGSEIVVKNELGDSVPLSCIEQGKNILKLNAWAADPGDYTVIWRTVSEDGHPVSGNFGFSVISSNQAEPSFTVCDNSAAPSVISQDELAEPATGEFKVDTAVVIGGTTGLLAVIGIAIFRFRRRS